MFRGTKTHATSLQLHGSWVTGCAAPQKVDMQQHGKLVLRRQQKVSRATLASASDATLCMCIADNQASDWGQHLGPCR